MRALEDLALNYDQKADALQAAYTEREKLEAELQRKDEHCVTLMNEIELLKEEKTEIQESVIKMRKVYQSHIGVTMQKMG